MMDVMETIRQNPELVVRYMASKRLVNFARYMKPKLDMSPFHKTYYEILDRFAHKQIKRLIVSVSPQSGKSEGSSRMLPAFLLGLNPDLKIVIGSYNADVAQNFNRDVQRIIKGEAYKAVFPNTRINEGRVRVDNVYRCNADLTEIIGQDGSLAAVGRNGSLTSRTVDISILDDVYKDFQEANSPTIRSIAWNWYTTVVRTRLHNDSQELIVFTRWHEDDIIGRLEKNGEKIVYVRSWKDIEEADRDSWILINFPAIKIGAPTELDPRNEGEALWPAKHSLEELEAIRRLDPVNFECLYQGDPGSAEGRLYSEFKTYTNKEDYGTFIRRGAMIDPAGRGTDFHCSVTYDIYKSSTTMFNEVTHKWEHILFALVTDIVFTDEGAEVTEPLTIRQLAANNTQVAHIESNSGGDSFADNIAKRTKTKIEKHFTSSNKEAKIVANAAAVNRSIIFPLGWDKLWPGAYNQLTRFLRYFKGNAHDDMPDVLSEIYLREIKDNNAKPYRANSKGVRRAN